MDDFEKRIATIIGNNVNEARKNILIEKKNGKFRKITQNEIAKRSGIERSTYAKIEKGNYIPRITTLIKVANVLNVEINDILKGI